MDRCLVDIKMIISGALMSGSPAFIVAHNHPSGNIKPSEEDIKITKRIKDAAKLMDMQLLDHLIVTTDGYTSLANEGHM